MNNQVILTDHGFLFKRLAIERFKGKVQGYLAIGWSMVELKIIPKLLDVTCWAVLADSRPPGTRPECEGPPDGNNYPI